MSLKSIGVVSNVFNILTKDLQNGKNAVIAMQFALRGMKVEQVEAAASALGLNAAQTAVALSAVKMEASEIALKLAMQGYDTETIKAALITAGFSTNQAVAAVTSEEFAAAQITASTATNTFTASIVAAAKGLLAFLTTNPVGWAILAAGAIFGIVKAYDALTVSAEEATEQMNESFSEFEEATRTLESLNKELETTNERIAELEAKDTLTFVEESELQKLRESVELLQIQADLAEKKAIREGKEAAEDTVTAYRKNFKNEISADAIDEYITNSTSTGNNAILFSDEGDISALLAGMEQMKKLRDELDKDSTTYEEDYEHFQGIIDDTTDTIWEQVEVLSDYKSKLKSIPYDQLSTDQQNALAEINSAIELIYTSLDPGKWKEMQWNGIVNNEQYTDDIERLKKLASNTKITADDIKKQFPEIVQVCEEAGLEIDDVVNNLNASYSHSVDDTLQETEVKVQTHGEKIKETLLTLWNAEGFADTKKTILELANSLDGITADNINDLASSSGELAALLEQDGMSARFLAHILQTEAMGGDGFALITDDALTLNEALEGLRGQFDEVTDAKSRYDAAMKAPEKDTDFKSYADAFKELNEQFVAGTTNSNAFWAAAEFLFGADQLQEWGWADGLDEIYSAMQKNVGIFKDADSAGAGFLDRLYAISEAGEIKADNGSVIAEIQKLSDGSYDFQFDSENLDVLADKLGITSEAAMACMQALSMYGDFNFYDVDAVMKAVEEIGLASDSIDGTAVNVGTLTDQLISLGYTNKDIYDLLNVLREVDGVTLLDANANVETLAQSLSDLGLAAQDGVEVTINADGLAELMSQLNFTKEDTQGLITKLGEADNITLTNAQGEVVDLNDALKKTDELEFASVTSELDGIMDSADLAQKAVDELQKSINTLKGKTVTITVDIRRKNGILGNLFGYKEFAKGTKDAPEGDALVGEKGEELVQSGDCAYLVGTNGPEITHLNEGDIVYTAEQTKKIKRGSTVIKGTVPAYAGGRFNTGSVYGSVLLDSGSAGSSGSLYSSDDVGSIISNIGELKDNIELLSKALNELKDNGRASIDTIESLDKSVGSLSGFNKVATELVKDGATIEQAQLACNELAKEMINTSGILDQVTEDNADMVAGMLESMGVVNAHELVWRKFGTSALQAKVAQAGLTNAAWEDVEAFLASTNATQGEIDALQTLRQEQYNAALAAVDFTKANADVTDELIKQAKAAGASSDKIEALTKIQKLQVMGKTQAEAQGYLEGAASFEEALSTLAERARIEIGDIDVDIPDVNVNIDVSDSESKKSANEKYNENEENKHDLKMYGTIKAYEAAVHKFSEAIEKFRQSAEAISKAEADIEMTDDPYDRFLKRFDLIEKIEQNQEDNLALEEERKDTIENLVNILRDAGFDVPYDREKNELIFPRQENDEDFDNAISHVDMENTYLQKMLKDPDFTVFKSGINEIDRSLVVLSALLKEQRFEIEKLNEKFGTDFTIYDFRQTEKYQRIDGSWGPISKAELYATGKYSQALEAMNAGNITEYRELISEYGEISSEVKDIKGIMERPVSVPGSTSLGDSMQDNGYSLWEVLENPNYINTTIGPAEGLDSSKFKDNAKEIESIYDTFGESLKNIAEEAEGYNEDNIQSAKDYLESQKKIRQAMKDALNDLSEYVQSSSQIVDKLQDVYSTMKAAAEEFSKTGGYLSLDTYQKMLDLGPQYMQYLVDENGQWVINEERIKAVTAAKAEQLALDTAWTYVERLKMALQEDSIENLDELLYATTDAAKGTWDLVYANLAMLNLDGEQYEAALHNIQVMRDLAYGAVEGINVLSETTSDSISDMSSCLDDLLKYVEEMIKQEVNNQVKALEDQVDEMKEIVSLQKKSLDLEKEKDKYTKAVADKEKAIADLRKQIAALDLDDSREAAAQKAKLQAELSDRINDLADYQSNHAYDAASDMLDDMADAYEKEKQTEIDILENSISSEEKVYQLAIERINNHWDTLYQDLINWNYEYGSVTNDEITKAWEGASAAVNQYGSYLNAVLETQKQIAAYESSSNSSSMLGTNNSAVANVGDYDINSGAYSIVARMKANSSKWSGLKESNDQAGLDALERDQQNLAQQLRQVLPGMMIERKPDGIWYINGEELYRSKYAVYHKGGVVGDDPTLKGNEVIAKLEKGETILTEDNTNRLYQVLNRDDTMLSKFGKLLVALGETDLMTPWIQDQIKQDSQQTQNIIQTGGDTIEVTAPIQVYTVQKLDKAEIRQLTRDISQHTITALNDTFIKRGKTRTSNPLKP